MAKNDLKPLIVDTGIESAKTFLGKLIYPAVEETGLLIKDYVALWRLNNEVHILNKAKEYCEKNQINPKAISLKLLAPLLENASFEENETLQDKWSILLSNLVDSEQNIENHVFPYILSQLSSNEFTVLESVYIKKFKRIKELQCEIDDFRKSRHRIEKEINERLQELNIQFEEIKKDNSMPPFSEKYIRIARERNDCKMKLNSNSFKESTILYKMRAPESVPNNVLKEYECSNLIRLGIIKEQKDYFGKSQTLAIPIDTGKEISYVDVDFDVDSQVEIILTELGELFISACIEKQKKIL